MGGKRVLFIIGFVLMVIAVFAQPDAGDPGGGAKPGTVPISGIEILIGLGGLFGARKLFEAARKKK